MTIALILLLVTPLGLYFSLGVGRANSYLDTEGQRSLDIVLEKPAMQALQVISFGLQMKSTSEGAAQDEVNQMYFAGKLPSYLRRYMTVAEMIDMINKVQSDRAEELRAAVAQAERIGAIERVKA